MRARWWRGRGVLALVAAAVLVYATWHALNGRAAAPVAVVAAAPVDGPHFFDAVGARAGADPPPSAALRRQLVAQLQMADHVYCSYRGATQYPPASRPMTQNRDQNRPNDPIASTEPMRLDGGGADPGIRLQAAQSRIHVAAGESVAFSLRAVDADGRALPLVVTGALAQGITYGGARPAPQVALAFADDGRGGDTVADDGAFAAVLAPSQSGLAGFAGTIRTDVRFQAGGKSGNVRSDVIATPDLPAVWAGPVREAVEDGSLNYYLKLDVREPGRYIVNGRVDDAVGQPIALLTFNDMLGPGPHEIKLTVFGKLLRDAAPAQPLTLRDVDGWLLKENADPDRALLPRLPGHVFSGAAHALSGFSDAEWASEERSRHLAEFAKDVGAARAGLAAFDPSTPLPPSACLPPPRP